MYFWDIKQLRYDLAAGPMRRSENVLYFLAIILFSSIFYEIGQYIILAMPKTPKISQYRLYMSGVTVISSLALFIVAYMINIYIDRGDHFYARVFPIFWVLSIRFIVFCTTIMLALIGFIALVAKKQATTSAPLPTHIEDLVNLILISALQILFCIRFWIHMYYTAKESSIYTEELKQAIEMEGEEPTKEKNSENSIYERIKALRDKVNNAVPEYRAGITVDIEHDTNDIVLEYVEDKNEMLAAKITIYSITFAVVFGAFGAAIAAFVFSIFGGLDGLASGMTQSSGKLSFELLLLSLKNIISGATKLSQQWISEGIKIGASFGFVLGILYPFIPKEELSNTKEKSEFDIEILRKELNEILEQTNKE